MRQARGDTRMRRRGWYRRSQPETNNPNTHTQKHQGHQHVLEKTIEPPPKNRRQHPVIAYPSILVEGTEEAAAAASRDANRGRGPHPALA